MDNTGSNPIDVVIPWVDDSDVEWLKLRGKYLDDFHENKKHLNHYFRDWDTLRYVFRGIEKNMPWIRTIHFITIGHLPEWLNTEAPKLKIHKHSDFFSADTVYPVFSSHPIEMNLKNIPGLAERFIYFNDDTLVMKPVMEDRFYEGNLPKDYLVWDLPRGGWLYDHIRTKDSYAQVCRNCIHLIDTLYPANRFSRNNPDKVTDKSYPVEFKIRNRFFNTFNWHEWIIINHNPQPHLLSNLKECERLFADRFHETKQHRFRDSRDLNQYIYRFYSLMSGRFIPHYFNDDFCIVLASVERYEKERDNLFSKNFVCLNDSQFLKEAEYPRLKKMVDGDLEMIFPDKSSFEI